MPSIRRNPMRKRKMPKRSRFGNKKLSRQVHNFKRTALISQITASNSGVSQINIAGAYTFSLSQLPNVVDFTSLYDQYKITGAKLSFVPGATEYIGNFLSG